MKPTREQFISWFDSLPPDERVDVWYECECMTRAEVDKLVADGRAAARRVEELEAWRREVLISQKIGGVDLNGAIAIADAGLSER